MNLSFQSVVMANPKEIRIAGQGLLYRTFKEWDTLISAQAILLTRTNISTKFIAVIQPSWHPSGFVNLAKTVILVSVSISLCKNRGSVFFPFAVVLHTSLLHKS